jgi:hypothetical protein
MARGIRDVPCGECTACCTSLPVRLHRPGRKANHSTHSAQAPISALRAATDTFWATMKGGHCPMFMNTKCSIYAHRPQNVPHVRLSRLLSHRNFPRTRISLALQAGANEWKFSSPSPRDQLDQDAVRAAGKSLLDHPELLPGGMPPHAACRSGRQTAFALFSLADPPGNLSTPWQMF